MHHVSSVAEADAGLIDASSVRSAGLIGTDVRPDWSQTGKAPDWGGAP
jgi:hypothetical protein